jgi:hypothetical protein
MLRRILSTEEKETMKRRLAELADIVKGEYKYSENVAPVLPVNRLRLGGFSSAGRAGRVKAASKVSPNRMVLHPERVERDRRLAELAGYIEGWHSA